jgi:uncharacterized protein (TIGR02246 family)
MDSVSTRNDLLELEHRFWTAMQEKDGKTAAAMTDDGCIVTGAQGVSAISAQQMEEMTVEGKWTIEEYSLDEKNAQVRMIGADVAIVAYKVGERLTVEGKPVSFDANDASVWVRRNGKWLCAMHTESLAGDPFGRDRKPQA